MHVIQVTDMHVTINILKGEISNWAVFCYLLWRLLFCGTTKYCSAACNVCFWRYTRVHSTVATNTFWNISDWRQANYYFSL